MIIDEERLLLYTLSGEELKILRQAFLITIREEKKLAKLPNVAFDKWLKEHNLYKPPYTTLYNFERQLLYECYINSIIPKPKKVK